MMNEKDLDVMTVEERKVIDKLKMEMLNAVSLHDLRFYKQEIQRIKEQAKKGMVF